MVRYALGDLDGSEEASIELTATTDESDVSSLELAYFDKTSNNFQLLFLPTIQEIRVIN